MTNWLDETYLQLDLMPRWITYSQIAQDTGLQVSWISAFAARKIEEPGIVKVQRLYNYIKKVDKLTKPEKMAFELALTIDPHTEKSEGVYCIYAGNVCLYVGSSHKVFKRIKDHSRKKEFIQRNPTHVEIQYVADDPFGVVRHELERARIKALNPIFNKMGLKV